MLERVFAECERVLEPGGRIAVNVANLGRRPYRSLAGDVTQILQDLGLLLRGEVVWWKGRGRRRILRLGQLPAPVNPVLRDVTERVVIASKGRFDRAIKPPIRARSAAPASPRVHHLQGRVPRGHHRPVGAGRPRAPPASAIRRPSRSSCPSGSSTSTPTRATSSSTPSWAPAPPRSPPCAPIATTSATTSTPTTSPGPSSACADVAAGRSARRCSRCSLPPVRTKDEPEPEPGNFQARAVQQGKQARDIAEALLKDCGFEVKGVDVAMPGGVEVNVDRRRRATATTGPSTSPAPSAPTGPGSSAPTPSGRRWARRRCCTSTPPSTCRSCCSPPTRRRRGSAGAKALAAVSGWHERRERRRPIAAVVEMLDADDKVELTRYAAEGRAALAAAPRLTAARVSADRTFVTELATGLGMLGGADARPSTLAVRPAGELANLSPDDWARLDALWAAGEHRADFEHGFANGRAFLAAPDALERPTAPHRRVDRPPPGAGRRGRARRPPGRPRLPGELQVPLEGAAQLEPATPGRRAALPRAARGAGRLVPLGRAGRAPRALRRLPLAPSAPTTGPPTPPTSTRSSGVAWPRRCAVTGRRPRSSPTGGCAWRSRWRPPSGGRPGSTPATARPCCGGCCASARPPTSCSAPARRGPCACASTPRGTGASGSRCAASRSLPSPAVSRGSRGGAATGCVATGEDRTVEGHVELRWSHGRFGGPPGGEGLPRHPPRRGAGLPPPRPGVRRPRPGVDPVEPTAGEGGRADGPLTLFAP